MKITRTDDYLKHYGVKGMTWDDVKREAASPERAKELADGEECRSSTS